MPYFTSKRGLKWNYEVSGSGETLVFIHGFGGSKNWWWRQKAFFEPTYQVITIDLPGHGDSSWQPVKLHEMALDIKELLEEFGLHQINIIASSFGGLIAFELYRLMSEQISRMSFVGAIAKFARTDTYPAGLDIDKIRTMSKQFEGNYASVLDIFFRSLFTMKERDSEYFKNLKTFRQTEKLPDKDALLSFLDMLEKVDLRDRLATVICPVQFITGEEDYLCPQEVMEWTQDHMLNARVDFIKDSGHLPFLSKPEEYNERLESFLIN